MEDSNKVLFDILNERLELLRQLDAEGDSERRRHIAKETQTLHAPMAHRLGLYQIKTEMEDLALKFLDYDMYQRKLRQQFYRTVGQCGLSAFNQRNQGICQSELVRFPAGLR